MSARITKAEARAAATALENLLSGAPSEWEFVGDDGDADKLAELIRSAADKLWDRSR